jgi:hypothetical protein
VRTALWVKGGNELEVRNPVIGTLVAAPFGTGHSPVRFGNGVVGGPGEFKYSDGGIDPNACSIDFWTKTQTACSNGYSVPDLGASAAFWVWQKDASNYMGFGFIYAAGGARLKQLVNAGGTLVEVFTPTNEAHWASGEVLHIGFTFAKQGSGPGASRVCKIFFNGALVSNSTIPYSADLPAGGTFWMGSAPSTLFGWQGINYYENFRVEHGARPGAGDVEYKDRNAQRAPARDSRDFQIRA